MIAEVAPLLKLPRSTSTFDYVVPLELAKTLVPGQRVSVPFRKKRSVTGVVIALKDKPFRYGIPLKHIKKLRPEAPLQPWQLTLATWLATYYHCSLGTALRLVVK